MIPRVRNQFEAIISPFTSILYAGVVVHSQSDPVVVILILSTLLVRNTNGIESIVPTKFVSGSVHAFPAMAQGIAAAPEGVCQLARPVASDMSTFPFHGTQPVILICHAISNFAVGALVPIPILPHVPYIQLPIES